MGGGLKAAGFEIGVVQSLARQLLLGGLGAAVFTFGTPEVWSMMRPAPSSPPPLIQTVLITPTPGASLTVALPPTATLTVQPTVTAPAEPSATAPAQATTPPTATATTPPAAPASAPAPTAAPASAPSLRPTALPGIRKDGVGPGR